MNKIIVYYKSKYGATKKYAEYIAEKLGCEIKDAFSATDEEISEYDIVIYGGGVYAGAIGGSNFLNIHESALKEKKLIVFAVGLTEYDEYTSSDALFKKNVPQSLLKDKFTFNFFGALDYKKMKFMEKMIVKTMLCNLKEKASYLKTPTDEKLIKAGKNNIDLIDFNDCEALLNRVRNIDAPLEESDDWDD